MTFFIVLSVTMPISDTAIQIYSNRNHLKGFFLVLSAGTIWSFGGLIVRYMVAAHIYRWQYLFFRGITISIVLLIFLAARERTLLISSFRKTGLSGLIGACGLVAAFVGFIWSITLTTVANSMFMLASEPFIAALLGIVLLNETVRRVTWAAMVIALIGIVAMVAEGLETGHLPGNLTAFISAAGFAVFSVSLRWRKETPKFTTVVIAGILCACLTLIILLFNHDSMAMPARNVYLSMLHGSIVGVGLILFSFGAKFLPAAELTLLSLVEVIGGVLWVYIPIFGIHEVPSKLTVIGGTIVLGAIMINSIGTHGQKKVIGIT